MICVQVAWLHMLHFAMHHICITVSTMCNISKGMMMSRNMTSRARTCAAPHLVRYFRPLPCCLQWKSTASCTTSHEHEHTTYHYATQRSTMPNPALTFHLRIRNLWARHPDLLHSCLWNHPWLNCTLLPGPHHSCPSSKVCPCRSRSGWIQISPCLHHSCCPVLHHQTGRHYLGILLVPWTLIGHVPWIQICRFLFHIRQREVGRHGQTFQTETCYHGLHCDHSRCFGQIHSAHHGLLKYHLGLCTGDNTTVIFLLCHDVEGLLVSWNTAGKNGTQHPQLSTACYFLTLDSFLESLCHFHFHFVSNQDARASVWNVYKKK